MLSIFEACKKFGRVLCLAIWIFTTPLIQDSTFAASIHHLPLDLSSREYESLLSTRSSSVGDSITIGDSDPLKEILRIGKRNLTWFETINSARPADQQLELTNFSTQRGIPIEAPSVKNRTIIYDLWAQLRSELPPSMEEVLFGQGDLPEGLVISDDIYLSYARRIDRGYQYASRWLLLEPQLQNYTMYAAKDVRGYFYLQKEPDLSSRLSKWSTLDADTQKKLGDWLIMQCINSDMGTTYCTSEFRAAIAKNAVSKYFSTYQKYAAANWNSFFDMPAKRRDISWKTSDTNLTLVPFAAPSLIVVQNWLRENIEDEWHLDDWHLRLDFRDSNSLSMTRIVFKDGATPHVDSIAGNIITMDKNRALDQYDVKWTIRHEYGHTLGFPDCYLEFYDSSAGTMISYQLDTTDLMCSRSGRLKQRHFDQLKKAYFEGAL